MQIDTDGKLDITTDDILSARIGIFGTTGSGKSYTLGCRVARSRLYRKWEHSPRTTVHKKLTT